MEKHLKVNTAIMDMTSTKPEAIQAYDQIKINCALCLTTAKTRQLLSQGRIQINTANFFDVGTDDDIEIVTINGTKKITAEFEAPKKTTILIVNGELIIEDSAKKNLDQYKFVILNGAALHPMSFDTSNFHVNGTLIPYPDGATLILQQLDLNDSFVKSATPGTTYYVQGKGPEGVLKKTGLRATEKLDLELLQIKNIHFYTEWLLTIEENAEQLMKIVDGNMGSTIIPTGYKIMPGGNLDMMAIRRFGKCIYVDGDLKIQADNVEALNVLEHLIIDGDVGVADSIADIFFEKCLKYNKLTVFKGEWIDILETQYTINKELLEDLENGSTFHIVSSNVEIHPDVTSELLTKKIHEIILNASNLTITPHQQNALRKLIVNKDSNINVREYECDTQPEPEPKEQDFIETKINSAYYKL